MRDGCVGGVGGGGGERDEVGLDYMKSKGTRNGLREREWGSGEIL